MSVSHSLMLALASAGIVSLVSLTGLLLFPMSEDRLQRVTFLLIGLATGALYGDAGLHLLPDLFRDAENRLENSGWLLTGILISFIFEKGLRWKQNHGLIHDASHAHWHTHAIKPVGRIILLSDVLHNLVDGIFIGASYLGGRQLGLSTTLAVFLHELPHEIGDFGVLLDSGYSRGQALWLNFMTACAAILGVGMAFLFHTHTACFENRALAFTAGSFIYIAGSNLTPELHRESRVLQSLGQLAAMMCGVGIMYIVRILE